MNSMACGKLQLMSEVALSAIGKFIWQKLDEDAGATAPSASDISATLSSAKMPSLLRLVS